MSRQLITIDGKRKYLDDAEYARFLSETAKLERGEVRTLCMTLAYTGCRISEALELTIDRVDLSSQALIFRTLKQRGEKSVYRSIPVPPDFLDALDYVHQIKKVQRLKRGGKDKPLWAWGRTQASKHIYAVMAAAGISGAQARPHGLRHAFGVRVAKKTRNPRLVQKMMGHASIETTAIYMDLVGAEARDEMALTW